MLDRYRDTSVEATYAAEDVKALGLDPTLERELSEVLRNDHWALGSGGGDEKSWSREISAGVVAAETVGDVEELMALIFGEQPDAEETSAEREPSRCSTVCSWRARRQRVVSAHMRRRARANRGRVTLGSWQT